MHILLFIYFYDHAFFVRWRKQEKANSVENLRLNCVAFVETSLCVRNLIISSITRFNIQCLMFRGQSHIQIEEPTVGHGGGPGLGCTTTSQTSAPSRLHLLGANWRPYGT